MPNAIDVKSAALSSDHPFAIIAGVGNTHPVFFERKNCGLFLFLTSIFGGYLLPRG